MLIIPDHKMPKSCYECPCYQRMDDRAFCLAKKDIRGTAFEMNPYKVQGGRNEWCPLIEKDSGIDFWDILIGKVLPVGAAVCFLLAIAALVKLILA